MRVRGRTRFVSGAAVLCLSTLSLSALSLTVPAHAESTTPTAKEQELERRIADLEHLVRQLSQPAAITTASAAPPTAPAASTPPMTKYSF